MVRSRRKRSSLLSSEVPCGELTGATTSPTPQTVYITGSHINSQCRAIMNRYTDIALGRAGSRDLLLGDRFIAGGQIYCWRTDVFLGDSFIAGGQIYCWGTDLLLGDRCIAGGQIYCYVPPWCTMHGASPVQSSCMCRNMLQTRLTCTACEAGGGRRSRLGLWLEENRVNFQLTVY